MRGIFNGVVRQESIQDGSRTLKVPFLDTFSSESNSSESLFLLVGNDPLDEFAGQKVAVNADRRGIALVVSSKMDISPV